MALYGRAMSNFRPDSARIAAPAHLRIESGRHGPDELHPAGDCDVGLSQAFRREPHEFGRFQGWVGRSIRALLRLNWQE